MPTARMVRLPLDDSGLTADQRALVEDWHQRWTAIGLLVKAWPGTLAAARASGMFDEDIAAAAYLAVCKAAMKFDPSRGVKFSTYANWWVRSGVQEAIREYAGRSRARLKEAGIDVPAPLSLDAVVAELETPVAMSAIVEADATDSDAVAYTAELLGRLDGRIRRAVTLRFGLDGGGDRKLRDVAAVLGVSKERSRQLIEKGLATMREETATKSTKTTYRRTGETQVDMPGCELVEVEGLGFPWWRVERTEGSRRRLAGSGDTPEEAWRTARALARREVASC